MTRVAIVHDYLTQRGGAERVVLAMARALPGAPIYTSFYEPEATFPEFASLDVRPMALNRVGLFRRDHRLALPLLAPAFSALRVDADVVVCSSSGWAHGVRSTGPKVVYCHAPARWLYQTDGYLAERGALSRVALCAMKPALLTWDRRAARKATAYIANSERTRAMVRTAYGLEAPVLHPPLALDPAGARQVVDGVEPGFFLCVSRLLPYKHVDAIVGAFAQRPDLRLVVVGDGPDAERLAAMATPNVTLLATADDDELRWLYANAIGLLAASHEDFGLTPVEAAAMGAPTAALRFGGYLETVEEGRTGVFFDEPSPAGVADGIDRLLSRSWDPEALAAHAATFGEPAFCRTLEELVTRTSF